MPIEGHPMGQAWRPRRLWLLIGATLLLKGGRLVLVDTSLTILESRPGWLLPIHACNAGRCSI